jgi:hypothetical protein
MKIRSFEGIIENGQIRLPANLRLPERAKVYVVVPDVETRETSVIHSPRLAHPEQADEFKKEVFEETGDASL